MLAALIATTLFITIDFDYPRAGFITLNPAPLENAVRVLEKDATAP